MKQLIHERKEQSKKEGFTLPLDRLSEIFSLSNSEISILILCLAPEIDSKYEKVYAYLHDDITKKRPTIGLIIDTLCYSLQEKIQFRRYFLQTSRLFTYKLLKLGNRENESNSTGPKFDHPSLSSSLKVDGHIVNLVLGQNEIDPRIQKFSNLIKVEKDSLLASSIFPDNLADQKNRIVELIRSNRQLQQLTKQKEEGKEENYNETSWENLVLPSHRFLALYFNAEYGAGKKTFAKIVCNELGLPLLIIDIAEILYSDEFEEIIEVAFREALLYDAIIYWDHFHLLMQESQDKVIAHNLKTIIAYIQNFSKIVICILSGEVSPDHQWIRNQIRPVVVNFPSYTYEIRKRLWDSLTKYYGIDNKDIDVKELASKFNFTPGQIRDAILASKNVASLKIKNHSKVSVSSDDVYMGCRQQSNEKLSSLCQKATGEFVWNDLVLPQDKKRLLSEILNYVKYKSQVYNEWGFETKLALGKGLNILFAGESGTGKTMAAQIIANELKLDLYKIDLSSVVSKYIGGTEKNLHHIFKEAEKSNAILFVDEADALCGKRSEVKDAHDKYANIEIAYLLQKLEEHREIVILASNLAQNIDDAIVRRMNFWVDFPFPDEISRLKIWKNIFPEIAPLSNDIDFDYLAKQFQISGGIIKNAALSAAFLAAEELKPISMRHIVRGIKREFDKIGKPCLKSDFNKYYNLLSDISAD